MTCPYCNMEMNFGYIQSARDIIWGEKIHQMFVRAGEDDIALSKGWDSSVIESYCCKNCKKIIFDYQNKK